MFVIVERLSVLLVLGDTISTVGDIQYSVLLANYHLSCRGTQFSTVEDVQYLVGIPFSSVDDVQ